MTPPVEWQDWLSDGFYRIRIAKTALAKLETLPEGTQERLRQMLIDIAEVADAQPAGDPGRGLSAHGPLLQLSLGRVSVRYSIDEPTRTLTVEHLVLLDDAEALSRTG